MPAERGKRLLTELILVERETWWCSYGSDEVREMWLGEKGRGREGGRDVELS